MGKGKLIMQDSIIVYRNPSERDFYEGGYAPAMLAFALAMGVTFAIVYFILKALFKRKYGWNEPTWFLWVAGTIGTIVGCIAFSYVFGITGHG